MINSAFKINNSNLDNYIFLKNKEKEYNKTILNRNAANYNINYLNNLNNHEENNNLEDIKDFKFINNEFKIKPNIYIKSEINNINIRKFIYHIRKMGLIVMEKYNIEKKINIININGKIDISKVNEYENLVTDFHSYINNICEETNYQK